ncbi:cellulose acetylase subunit [Bordetella ansorpii]|uniref:Cellulose acetylase subunit n=1 Tax=Bordetella ansorpii TaxID=288768 RepID=A0A157S8K3_9BORD|nr:cell division protein FtsQ [Bordetella ansorpii]SAI66758.1 cellulose acetylase subunit [Bordetella ansorpii]
MNANTNTTPPYAPATRTSKLAAVGLIAFLAAGFFSNGWGVLMQNMRLMRDDPSLDRVLDGTAMRDIANHMSDAPLTAEAARLQRGLGWMTLRDLGPRVRQGCEGWLFLRDELLVHRDAQRHAQARADTVLQVRQALAKRDIGLLVAVVPDKTRIESEHLCGLHRPAEFENRASGWIARLAAQGVPVVDLAPVMKNVPGDAYLRTDTHWNEAGAGAAARAVADRIRALGTPLQPAAYKVEAKPEGPRPGDLVRLAGLDWLPARWQPRGEIVQEHVYTAQAQSASSADDLFGDAGLPTIAVLGTSYSRTSNFVPQLSQALGGAVGNFARDGGQFGGAAQAYFPSTAYTQTPPKLIVWEINERDLQTPLTDADAVHVK